ncbi:hypothetical protein HAX54_043947, partial [Datura stramonium]|nr:hypothetical protein [Datura stramonium]
IAIVFYDVRHCVIDEVLKEVRLPMKLSYFLEQCRCSDRIPAMARLWQRSSYYCSKT